MKSKTQRDKIQNYCNEHGSITVREAFEKLNINSPTKRISEMRKSGLYDVSTAPESRINHIGDSVKYIRYFITPVDRGEAQ